MRLSVLVLFSFSLFAADDSASAWFNKFNEIHKKGNYSADISLGSKLDFNGAPGEMSAKGKVQTKDESHVNVSIVMDVSIGEQKFQSNTQMIADGTTYWSTSDTMGQKMTMKATIANIKNIDPQTVSQLKSFDVTNIANDLMKSFDFKPAKFENGKVSFDGTLKASEESAANPLNKLTVTMDEKEIFPVKFVMSGAANIFMTVEMSNYKSVDQFADETFKFTPDPASQLIDLDSYGQEAKEQHAAESADAPHEPKDN